MRKSTWRLGALLALAGGMVWLLAGCSGGDSKDDKKDSGSADSSDSSITPTATAAAAEPTKSPLGNSGGGNSSGPGNAIDAPPPSTGIGSGKIIADLGFRPEKDGFPFENYGDGPFTNLTPAEVRRIFGDGVCADIDRGNCILTPPAEEWMTVMNGSMGGGHCYGFSVATLRMYKGEISPAPFGAMTTDGLKLDGNKDLQAEIAYSFVYQMFDPVRANIIQGTPNEVLQKMIDYLQKGPSSEETYTIGFFKAEGGGGHAVTPIAVEDRGKGQFAVLIYDNNFPRDTREMLFDTNKNSWSYVASINPNEPASKYVGNADTKSLGLYPTTPGTVQQPCPFCADGGSAAIRGGSAYGAAAPTYNEIYLDGNPEDHGHLLITDDQGRRTGYLNGKLLNEIPGAIVRNEMFEDNWKDQDEPTYRIPTGIKLTITIDGSGLKKADMTDVVLIGPGYDIGVNDISLAPGQKDTLVLSPDGKSLSYKTTASESPIVIVGFDGKDADYGFAVQGVDVDGGGTINVTLDTGAGSISIGTAGNKNGGTYGAAIVKIDDNGEQVFGHDNIDLQPDDVATLMYGKWPGNGKGMPLVIKRKAGGTETLTLTDDN